MILARLHGSDIFLDDRFIFILKIRDILLSVPKWVYTEIKTHRLISTYTRKNEIGKEALEVTRKFGVDVEKLFEIIRNSIDYRIRIEKLEKRFTEPLNETQRKEDRKDGNDIEKRIEKMDKRYTETLEEIQAQHEKNNL